MASSSTSLPTDARQSPSAFLPARLCGALARGVRTVAEVCRAVWFIVKQWFSRSEYEIKSLDLNHLSFEMEKKLKEFERGFDYPINSEKRFRILHGKGGDYFGFFKRLGTPKFYVAIHKKTGEIAGLGCGILRELGDSKPVKAWYLCDFKVKKEHQGKGILSRLMQRGFWHYFQCPRGYAICMNPADGSDPRPVRIWQHRGAFPSKRLILNLYNIKAEAFTKISKQLEQHYGPIAFKSMRGLKEFEIFQTSDPARTEEWRILHIQHGPKGELVPSETTYSAPQQGYDHLIAAIEGSARDCLLASNEAIEKFSSATLIYHGLNPDLFSTILTNEI